MQVLTELLSVKICTEDEDEPISDDDSFQRDDEPVAKKTCSPFSDQIKETLDTNAHKLVVDLLDSLSNKNPSDSDKSLTARSVLFDFCEQKHCFKYLANQKCLKHLISICNQGESNWHNL